MKEQDHFLKILYLGDKVSELNAIKNYLRNSFHNLEMKQAKTEKELFKFILRFRPDIILSEAVLEKYSVLLAIDLLKEENYLAPVILILNEKNDVLIKEYRKKGMEECLLKSELSLLPEIINKAVEKNELLLQKNKIETELKSKRERLQAIFENAPEAIINIGFKGEILEINPKGLHLLQVDSKEKLEDKTIFQFIHPEDIKKYKKFHNSVGIGNKKNETFRITGARKKQSIIESSAVPVVDGENHIISVLAINRDMTDITETKSQFEHSEEKFSKLAMNAPVGIFLTDEKGDSVFVNKRWCEFAGLEGKQAMGNGWIKALHPEDRENVVKEWYNCALSGKEFKMEYRFRKPDGEITWLSSNAVAMHNSAGGLTGFIGTITDISDHRKRSVENSAGEKKFQDLFDFSPDGIYVEDENGYILNVNNAACEFMGYSKDEIIGKHIRDFTPDAVKNNILYSSRLIQKQNNETYESYCWDRNWNARPVEINSQNIVYNDKPALLLIMRDITKRKKAEKANRELKMKFNTLAEEAPVAIYQIDKEGNFTLVNKKFLQLFDVAREDIVGDFWKGCIHPDDLQGFLKIRKETFADNKAIEIQYRLFIKGQVKFVIGKSNPLLNDDGEVTGRIGTILQFADSDQSDKKLFIA